MVAMLPLSTNLAQLSGRGDLFIVNQIIGDRRTLSVTLNSKLTARILVSA